MPTLSRIMTLVAGLAAATLSASANVIYFSDAPQDRVRIIGTPGTTGSLISPNGYKSYFTIGEDGTATIGITYPNRQHVYGSVSNNGFILQTDNPHAVISARISGGDQTAMMDSRALSRSYIATSYAGTVVNNHLQASLLYVVGTKDGTTVRITPSASGFYRSFSDLQEVPYTTPFTITLNKGQTAIYQSADVTGAKVNASAAVAVYGGAFCASPTGSDTLAPTTAGCPGGKVITAIPGTDHFTRSAVVPTSFYATGSNVIGDRVRVVAKDNNTVVTWNGKFVAKLKAGEFTEFDSGRGGVVDASKPVLVSKITKFRTEGDLPQQYPLAWWSPGMTWLPGTDQWRTHYVYSFDPAGALEPPDFVDYLDIAIQTRALWTLRLNGERVSASDCRRIGNGWYSTCEIAIDDFVGEIWASQPFLALIVDASYSLTFAGADFLPQGSIHPRWRFAALADSVPLPATALIFAAGLLLVGGWRRQRGG